MTENKKFLFLRLQPGITTKHMLAFYFGAFVTIGFAVLINTLQPYLFSNFLGLSYLEQGPTAGSATFAGEIILIPMVALWGLSSDKLGRRNVYVWGLLVVGLGFALLPLAETTYQLYAYRMLWAFGAAAATGMLATLLGDYVIDADRGKATGLMGVMNGTGAATMGVLGGKIPGWLNSSSYATADGRGEGWFTYLVVAAIAVFSALILWRGLAGKESQRENEENIPLGQLMREGIGTARKDVGVMLSFVTAFVARADLAMAGVFLPLWCSNYLVEQARAGLAVGATLPTEQLVELTKEGVAKGGLLIAVVGGSGLIAGPAFGILCDRINRVSAVAIALFLNTVAYGATYYVSDPTSGAIFGVAFLIGCGEVGGVISTQVFVQQQAPAKVRGAVIGMFGMFGGLGIAINSVIGGQLFSKWLMQGPFVWLAGLNLVVALMCVALRSRVKVPVDFKLAEQPESLRPGAGIPAGSAR